MLLHAPGRRDARLVGVSALAAVGLGVLAVAPPALALTDVTTDNDATVFINDARRPGLDTGSIRNVSDSRMEGFGNIFVHIDSSVGEAPLMNDQMMRGFGLTPAAPGSYRSTKSVRLGDVLMTRKVRVAASSSTISFFDTFKNTSAQPVTLQVSFGGSLGSGFSETSPNKATITQTSSGDSSVDTSDTWITATTPGNTRPTGVVVGSGVDALGDQQANPFTTPYVPTGSRSNDLGFVRELTVEPDETTSLAQYVVIGDVSDGTAIVTDTAALAESPDFSNLTIDEICTIDNWDLSSYEAACVGAEPLQLPAAEVQMQHSTDVAYDVTGKTIADLQADMTAGRVTSVQITKAYLDRIAAYDSGALGFHSFITVAEDAVGQALAADRARAAGRTGDLLGVPIALKDLYDTKDMPTSGGTLALKDWEPGADAWQVARLRDAGAVIIGKTNLSEFARSGSWSDSGFMQTWNALYPSKTSFGSSGGSATAVAADLAAAAMGTQTGVSLYAPATGASLATFRGTDGLTSTSGVMPLTWATDYAGPIAKSVTDLASLLEATATRATGNNPEDLLTSRVDNSLRPTEWKSALRVDALEGKVIGYRPESFRSSAVTDDNAGQLAFQQAEAAIEAAGGTLMPLAEGLPASPPAPPREEYPTTGNAGAEGWERYIAEERPAAFPYTTEELMEHPANLPYNAADDYTLQPMDDVSVQNLLDRRDAYKESADAWMDTAFGSASEGIVPVDAVLYPGFLTSIGNNDATSAIFSADRGSGVITQTVGLPTVVVPIGDNAEGQSNSVQIVGRAWSDTEVLGMGYALEQQTKAARLTEFAPALPLSTAPAPVNGPSESATSVTVATGTPVTGTPGEKTAAPTVTIRGDTGSVGTQIVFSLSDGARWAGAGALSGPDSAAASSTGSETLTYTLSGPASSASFSLSGATIKLPSSPPHGVVTLTVTSNGRTLEAGLPYASVIAQGRISGGNRYETAAQAFRAAGGEGRGIAVLATGLNFPDALAANALAGELDTGVLLTGTNSLPAPTRAALVDAADPSLEVYLVGGEEAISPAVVDAIRGLGRGLSAIGDAPNTVRIIRVAGSDRIKTAEAVAAHIDPDNVMVNAASGPTAIVASGWNYPDALAIGAASYAYDMPLFLTDREGTLSDSTLESIAASGATNVIIVGGELAVPAGVEAQLKARYNVLRLSGGDRYATAAAIADWELQSANESTGGLGWGMLSETQSSNKGPVAYLATGTNFPDALAGGAVAGSNASPLFLVPLSASETGVLSSYTADVFSSVTAFGGTLVVPDSARIAAGVATAGVPNTPKS